MAQKKYKISKIEETIGKKLKRKVVSLGFDIAKNHTGIAVITSLQSTLEITKLHKIDNIKGNVTESMEYYLAELNNFISGAKLKGYKIFVLEDSWYGRSVLTFKTLVRYGALTWRELKHIADLIYFISPSSARKKIGFKKDTKSKKKAKEQVRDYINGIFKTELKDMDLTDGLALALSGLVEVE